MTEESDQNFDNEEVNLPDADISDLDAVELEASVQKLKMENEQNKDKYLRALAEFENYKKRAMKERSDLLKYQGEKVFYDMLEVLDNLELALQHSDADPAKLKEGLQLIHKSFVDILSKWDVKPEPSVGKEFDPSKHSALSKIQVPNTKAGTVVNELKKPYFYKDKLIRVGEVVVADEPPAESSDS